MPVGAQPIQFGYYPEPLEVQAGPVTIVPLPNLAETVAGLARSDGIHNGWLYAPAQKEEDMFSRAVRTLPYPSRVFGLPKTHTVQHLALDSNEHLSFHLWTLSFFTGMVLTATEAGFVDATPLKPGSLVDFHVTRGNLARAIELSESFWMDNRDTPQRPKLVVAAINALFLGQNPVRLQFESFILLYIALDACFALASSLRGLPRNHVRHGQRVTWMCALLKIPVPPWAANLELVGLRNATLHEALFAEEPLGFAIHRTEPGSNFVHEMQALVCRLLLGLLGAKASYVRSPINTRQIYGLDLDS